MTRMRATFLSCLVMGTSLCSTSALAATDAEFEALKAQLKAVTDRLATLEKEQAEQKAAAAAAPQGRVMAAIPSATGKAPNPANPGEGQPVVGGSMPGSFKLPGTDTSIKFGGYAKLDAIGDINNSHGGQFANFGTIPLDGSAADRHEGKFNAHARQSRLNMETRTPTAFGELKTFMEIDFFHGTARGNPNTTNGEGLQLRQAYGQVGRVLAGQTWSNFMDMDAYPESLDYIGPAGLTFVRQAQVKYTDSIDDKWSYAFSVESPQTDFAVAANKVSMNTVPDFIGKLQYKDTFGHLALRGLARQLKGADSVTGEEDSSYGWGLALSGKILAGKKDSFIFQGVYGDGVGHYLFDVASSLNGTTYVANNLRPQVAYGGYVGYQHYWSDSWRSNFLAGYTGIDNDISLTGLAVNESVASGHVNLIWSPVPQYRVGVEYMHGYREQESGAEGSLNRVQASFMYLF